MSEDKIISNHKSLTEIKIDLCIEYYDYFKAEQDGHSVCKHCRKRKNEHLHDGRCSSSACSFTFANAARDRFAQIEKALSMVEELLEM